MQHTRVSAMSILHTSRAFSSMEMRRSMRRLLWATVTDWVAVESVMPTGDGKIHSSSTHSVMTSLQIPSKTVMLLGEA